MLNSSNGKSLERPTRCNLSLCNIHTMVDGKGLNVSANCKMSMTKFIISYFLISALIACNEVNYIAGENHSVCVITYNNSELNATRLLDSITILNPELGKRNQDKYTYNSAGTGYVSKELYFWKNNKHYVLSFEPTSNGNYHSLRLVNFGIDGEVLSKTDGMTSEQIDLAKEIMNTSFIKELETHFTNVIFYLDCMD